MMMQGEPTSPMALGSPQSPSSPSTTHTQHQFLPAYLMGEPAPAVTSPTSSRMWTSMTGSPPRSHGNRSSQWPAGSGTTPSQSHTTLGQSNTSMFSQSPRTEIRPGGRPKEKSGAPPVHGLLESIQNATPSSGRKPGPPTLDISQNASFRQASAAMTPGFQTPGSSSTPSYAVPKKTPPSPAQRDPFYTQGDTLKPDDELDETWITIFGFPPAATSYILQQFSQYGSIIKHVIASDGNWMHIHYQSKFQAKKALSKNGRIFGGSIMVGVTPCIDKSVMDDKENMVGETTATFKSSFVGTPTQSQLLQQNQSDRLNISRNTPIRPLTAAYKAASSEHEVVAQSNTPQKNTGLISKAVEYVFGW